jgi:subtilisin-like proprotein convertase family protein
MNKSNVAATNKSLLLGLIGLGLAAVFILIPTQFRSKASVKGEGLFKQTKSDDPSLPNYDIRIDKVDESANLLSEFRSRAGKNAVNTADAREEFVKGENALRTRMPNLKVEYNEDLKSPEVIGYNTDGRIAFLSSASNEKRAETLRNFIKQNNSLLGLSDQQANDLIVTADYTNPDGNLSYARLEQKINGIPVFRGEANAGFTRTGEMFRIINNIAPNLDYSSLSTDFGNPSDAVISAAKYINHELKAEETTRNAAESTDLKSVFGSGDWATTAEKMYFPTEPGVARASWKVLIWQPVNAFYVIIDAETGKMLWRKNITADQTQSATYNVYGNMTSPLKAMTNPAPITPSPIPTLGSQGTLQSRTNFTLIGNEAPYTFNNNGWITDGTNGVDGTTDGNAVESGLDIDGVNGVDPAGKANGTGRVFNFSYTPATGNPGVGDVPTLVPFRNGAVTQSFYYSNRYHDELYRLGFTELARNFQASNFGRGGVENDRVSGEAQDSAGTNNANFSITSDGTRGRMQMFLFTTTPQRDGDLDGDVLIHELTHGTSGRLVGNGAGLTGTRAGSMGEGWSDFYGLSLLSTPSENPLTSVATTGGYVTLNFLGIGTTNYYYGIRRFPYAVMSLTGGPSNLPHNPMTFADIDPAQISLTNGAFSSSPGTFFGGATEVHNAGEVWCVALWEVRAKFIARLGNAAGNMKTLQIVTDGMKLSPLNPNFIQERDSIIAAAAASAAAPEASVDVADVREGFRIRGMGFGAVDAGSAVTESFLAPNAIAIDPFTVSDSTGNNNGFPETGENVLLNVSVNNPNTGAAITSVTANVNGGANVAYGTIADGATVVRQIPFTVTAACGTLQTVTINVASSVGTQAPITKTFRVGVPVGGAPATFSNSAAITINDNAPATPYPSNITVSGLTGNKVIKVKFNQMNHTFPGDIDMLLVGPGGQKMEIMSDQGGTNDLVNVDLTLSDTAAASLPATITTGEFKPTADAGQDVFAAPAPAGPYQLPGPGGAATLGSVYGSDGAAMNGVWSLHVVDDAGIDTGNINGGWSLTFESNNFECLAPTSGKRSDFDGDGKTDLSVFRPSEGNWYLNRSMAGFGVINFGVATDVIAPGDIDGDNKTDEVVFRASASAGTPDFFTLRSSTNTVSGVEWGTTGDMPVIADYDGDNKDDFAVWRPSTGDFWLLQSTAGARHYHFGATGDKPVPADYNGDSRTDFAVWRPSTGTWYVADNVTNAVTTTAWGVSTDMPVFADYNGDSKDDIAVFRPSNGTWYIINSGGGTSIIPFGASGDVPVPGDYDGDGKYDQAVYRAGTWFVNKSTSGVTIQPFGLATDRATPRWYVPQ